MAFDISRPLNCGLVAVVQRYLAPEQIHGSVDPESGLTPPRKRAKNDRAGEVIHVVHRSDHGVNLAMISMAKMAAKPSVPTASSILIIFVIPQTRLRPPY